MEEIKQLIKDKKHTLNKSIVATPEDRQYLEKFVNSNNGANDFLVMQMSIQFGYAMAIEDMEEIINKENNE